MEDTERETQREKERGEGKQSEDRTGLRTRTCRRRYVERRKGNDGTSAQINCDSTDLLSSASVADVCRQSRNRQFRSVVEILEVKELVSFSITSASMLFVRQDRYISPK